MTSPIITQIEWARLTGRRPRHAGRNARLDEHGDTVRPALARIHTSDGATGWGFCRAPQPIAESVIGQQLADLFIDEPLQKGQKAPGIGGPGATALGAPFDFPLWDLMARRAQKPVYALAAELCGKNVPDSLQVPCYDTSLYFDDLHLADHDEAAALIAREAQEGWARGHRAFKLKVGRGARHMELAAGTQRDIDVIRAVRAAIGPQTPLMLDANNGYNLNLTKQVLAATADCRIFWMEEAFYEDPILYTDLVAWMRERGLDVLVADGEGEASPSLLAWAQSGKIQVIQYDIFSYGFTAWLRLGRQLDSWDLRSAPHHYGAHYGNYAAPHLAAVIEGFTFAEWDEATTPGIDDSGYSIEAGQVHIPDQPGFGLALDEDIFAEAVRTEGYRVTSRRAFAG